MSSKFQSNQGMYRLALKMLFRDRVRYFVLLGAFVFANLLITQQTGVFLGLLSWGTSTITNLNVPLWIMDPHMEQTNEVKPMKDTDVNRVRSIPGIAWAFPIHSSFVQAKLKDGDYKNVQLIGLDSTTLIGRPTRFIEGNIDNLRLPNAVVVDDLAVKRFGLKMWDNLELNDREARVVGIFDANRSFFGAPYLMTTYERALQFAPPSRKMVSFVIAAPQTGVDVQTLLKKIELETGLQARTASQFAWQTVGWFFKNTGIPISFGTTIILGFLVGVVVSIQTFYAFIVENLKNFATFKAMGVSSSMLGRMLFLQSMTVGLMGYGVGTGLASLFGWGALKNKEPPFLMPYQLILFTFCITVLICFFTSIVGWRKIRTIEAGIVFR